MAVCDGVFGRAGVFGRTGVFGHAGIDEIALDAGFLGPVVDVMD